MSVTNEEKLKVIKKMRPIDDVFFESLALEPGVCEEILQIILADNELKVIDTITQASKRNIYGRSVILDTLCSLGDGRKCNIEIQRSDNDHHLKRVRFNAASITVKDSQAGDDFSKVIDLCVIYISEFDIFGDGLTTYHIDKVIRENGKIIDDGLNEIFVNTAIDDGSDIADLMRCFLQRTVDNPKFPKLSRAVSNLKDTEGGRRTVCEAMKEIIEREKAEGRAEGRAEARAKERLDAIKALIKRGDSIDSILELGYTDDEIKKAKA